MSTDNQPATVKSPVASEERRAKFPMVAATVGLTLILVGGVAHGLMSNRWGVPVDQQARGQQLREIPLVIGPWEATEDKEMAESTIALLECQGYINRIYVHQLTGEAVSVAVLFGPKGPIAVHTPEVCYSSRDYTQKKERQPTAIDAEGVTAELWNLDFEANNIEKSRMTVYYGWSDGQGWQAAERPRFWRTDYLYKVQTSCQPSGAGGDPTLDFLSHFLPALQQQLGGA
jgi:hypothetical protein